MLIFIFFSIPQTTFSRFFVTFLFPQVVGAADTVGQVPGQAVLVLVAQMGTLADTQVALAAQVHEP